MKTRSLSLALAFCFSGAPALDAADITIDQLVDSVSGILGGSWSVAGNAAPNILNPQGAAPTGITGGGAANTTPGTNNPAVTSYILYGSSGLFNDSTNGLLNTSALGGATQALSSTTLGSLNIYDWSTLNPWLKQVQDMAGTYYSDRASFSGVSSAGNVLGTGPISGSTWWKVTASKGNGTIGTGAEAAVAGAFSASSTTLGTPPKGTTASDYADNANKLMSTIYNNIIGLADNTNLLGANTNGNDYGQDLSALLSNSGSGNTIYSAGLSLADAASTAAAAKTDITTPGLAQSVQTINSIMFTTPSATDSIIPTGSAPANGQGTNYSDGSPGALDALQGLGALNSLIAGGIATSATELNANATTVATAVEAYNTNANALLNNITNIGNPTATTPSGLSSADANVDAVINALAGVTTAKGDTTYATNQAVIDKALSGLNGIVNPGAYQVVWDAYQGLASSLGSDQAKALGITTTTNVQSAIFNKLQQASQAMGEIAAGATTIGGGANAALSSSTFGGSRKALSDSSLSGSLKAIYNLFNPSITSGSGSSATTISPYQEFQNTISGLQKLVDNTTQSSVSATNTPTTGKVQNTTTLYPAQIGSSAGKTGATAVTDSATPGATTPIDQSIAASGLANQLSQAQASNVALAKLIGLAASYAGNVNTLNGMLSTAGQAGLGAALGAAANNAAANALLNGGAAEGTDKADAANNAAKIYNTITEIKNADALLNQYVNALTANVVGDSTTNQGNYAYALGEFNKLLNAPQSGANDTGLITSTLDSINKLLAGYNAAPTAATGASKTFWTAVQAGDAKAAIQTLQESVSSGLNYLANQQSLVQGTVNGTVSIDSQVAGSLLGNGGLGVSNAQMANAVVAVNSLSGALTQLSSDLNGGAASTTVISTLMGTGSNNLASIVGLLSTLNTATAAATASFGDQGGIANTSNIATGDSNTGGVGSGDVGGNFAENTNAPNYINNLAALSTITNAIGDIANASGATSNFTNAFVTNTPVATIQAEWAKITGDLKTNDSTNQALAIAALETNDTTALGNLLASGAGGVGAATTAWQTITQTDNLLSTFNSALTADNQVSNLTLSGKDATAASSVLKLLTLATDLQGAVKVLTTADTGLATANVSSNALNVDAATASSFVNAQNAASAYSALQNALAAINKGGATLDADGLLGVIRQINIYQQNTAVLNGLKGANATKSVAQIEQVLANMLTGTAPNTVAGTATQAGLQAIQNLINRYNYLEGLSTQVNTALSNNPIALLDAFSNSKDNTNFKDALESLGTAGFSANVANNYGTLQASGNYAATTGLTQQALTSLSNAISNNSDAIQAWGTLVKGTSGSTTTALQTAASAATNLASLYGSVSTGSLNSLDNNLSNVTSALAATTTDKSGSTADLTGNTFAIASAPAGVLTGVNLDDKLTIANYTSNTLYQAFQAINTLNQELNGGNTTDVANLGTGATAVDAAITALNGSANNGAVANLLNNFSNAISSTNSFVPDNLNNITEGYGKTSAASLVQGLMDALNNPKNGVAQYFQGKGATSLPSGQDLTNLVTQVQNAISGVVGSTNAATITSGTLSAFATAAQQINAQITALDTATGQTNISLATVAGLIDAYNLASAAIASGGVAGLKADQVSVIASTVSDAQAFNNVASAANQVAYITNNLGALVPSASSPNMSDLGTKPMGIGGLIAQQLQADGLAPMSGQTISAYINTATPAQLQTAIQSVVNSSAYQNSPQLQAAIKALMVGQAIADTANYSDNSATVSSSDALKALIANANAVQALQKAGVNTATGSGAALSNGTLSKVQLEGLAGAIAGLQKTASTIIAYNSDTPAAQLAKAYEAAQTNNNNATSSLATLASGASKTSSASVSALQQAGKEYIQSLSGPTGVVAIQARSMASNSSWQFGTMINALSDGVTASSLNTSGIDSDIASNAAVLSGVANLQTAVSNLVATIYGPQGASQNTSFSVSQVQAQLGNLVNQIGALQEQVVQAMVALSNAATAANNPQAMVQNRALMGYLKQGFGGTTPPSASQRQANLVALQALMSKLSNLKSTALAAQLKYDGNGQVQKILAAENAPRRPVLSTQNGNMYGIDVQFGYKQFFGKKKRWGLRYYASFSYQHGTFNVSDADDVDNFVYGAGVDALYNFYESKDGNHTVGMFAGLMLAGSSWNVKGMSYYKNLMAQINAAGGKASMNTSYFQIPINIGFRTNVNRHNGFEIGLRIPLATNYFFDGTGPDGSALKIAYKRNISVFFNYVYNF
ncbi:outer membrane beta-barrel protein [Helicobacter bizzozeronii]|uniref:outer membrane beta-barrel protein n=1 Tax=Helicobacter bizzozeronii TaxID=56877 RepID=UPI000CEE3728|nr:outer membrane beta-barrel protein [Helicobacter bizzozeronii]